MDLEKIAKLWCNIESLLKTNEAEKVSPEELGELLTETYNSLVGEYRPLVQVLPSLAEPIANDFLSILVMFNRALNNCNKDPELISLKLEGNRLKAELRSAIIGIYITAGFTREEAINFIMQDIVATQVLANKIQQQAKLNTGKNN